MKKLPPNVTAYKKTPIFTQETIPKGLLHRHTTKEGSWGNPFGNIWSTLLSNPYRSP